MAKVKQYLERKCLLQIKKRVKKIKIKNKKRVKAQIILRSPQTKSGKANIDSS